MAHQSSGTGQSRACRSVAAAGVFRRRARRAAGPPGSCACRARPMRALHSCRRHCHPAGGQPLSRSPCRRLLIASMWQSFPQHARVCPCHVCQMCKVLGLKIELRGLACGTTPATATCAGILVKSGVPHRLRSEPWAGEAPSSLRMGRFSSQAAVNSSDDMRPSTMLATSLTCAGDSSVVRSRGRKFKLSYIMTVLQRPTRVLTGSDDDRPLRHSLRVNSQWCVAAQQRQCASDTAEQWFLSYVPSRWD